MTSFSSLVAETPIGPLTVVMSSRGVVATFATDDPAEPQAFAGRAGTTLAGQGRDSALVRRELDAYFRGRLERFQTPVDLSSSGNGFSRRVLEHACSIPYGELRTYGDVAAAAGSRRAARAAGGALARCPIEVFVPCHRVVGAGPSLGSYGGHDERRRFLLRLEGAIE
ncbi:MAG: methylated-DNA-[protein]-cysteine S-methyltransferase [Actinomycetota bacterium]|nr:methylated-DNA-[protein]-cysteine S-methyltransferase [Actinomycetota bacterium]